jgi:hypothetical protein
MEDYDCDELEILITSLTIINDLKLRDIKNHYQYCTLFRAKFYFDKVKRFGDVPWYGRN